MIVFSPYFDSIEWVVGSMGKYATIYNFTSSVSDYYAPLPTLIPNPDLMDTSIFSGDFDSMEFDFEYARSIIQNPESFNTLMTIMTATMTDPNEIIILLTDDSSYRNAIKESLRRLIQGRYGYQTYEVNNKEELIELIFQDPQESVSILGLHAYEQDRELYLSSLPPGTIDQIVKESEIS